MSESKGARWWEGAVLYQVYVRSFADSDDDGYGDLRGLIGRLDHLCDLGVDGIWLSPTMPSPDTDWGYDVSDYGGVHPELGTLEDLEELLKEADQRGLRVLLDLVPNHTSSAHPWFVAARQGRSASLRDWYVWADPVQGGGPPNNWIDATGESAWTFDEESGQYYLHNFLETQPDLNWWNADVHAEFRTILREWFDRGVAGFRIDVAHGLYKDAALRDDPPALDPDSRASRYGLEPTYSAYRPETHEVFREWRTIAEDYDPPRLLLGETWVLDLARLASYYGADDELQLGFNFPFAFTPFEPPRLASVVRDTLSHLGPACPVWTASNHDIGRFPTHWAKNDERATRAALTLLTMLPGTVVLYYGDEVGMTDVFVPRELQRDPMTWGNRGDKPIRDRARTPLVWTDDPGGGFSAAGVKPWLPAGPLEFGSVEDQRDDPHSVLALTRNLLKLRRAHQGGRVVAYEEIAIADDWWMFGVGALVVAMSFSDAPLELEVPAGHLELSSCCDRTPGALADTVTLRPHEAVVCLR